MWADVDPRTDVGKQSWEAAARNHFMELRGIRGTGPLVSGLMGMDVCVELSEMERGNGDDVIASRTQG